MDNQEYNSIVSFIWGIADDCLRDVYVRGKYRDVILPMTVIRRLDAMLEGTKKAVLTMKKQLEAAKIDNQWPALCNTAGQAFCNASPFLLKDLTSRAKKQTLEADFKAYWNVTVERPLRLRVFPEREIPEDTFKKQSELDAVREAIAKIPAGTPLDDWDAFAKATKLKKTQLKKIRPFITETDPHAKEVEGESDPNLRDSENIPFNYDGGIDAFIEKEVKPYAPDAYVDESKTRIGYEISFTKYFYKPVQLRDMKDILASLEELERESDGVMDEIVEGLK